MRTGRLLYILVMLCVLTAGVGRLDAAENSAVPALVFADFDSSAAGQYAYLGGSIRGMLAARLAADGGLRVVDRTFSEKELASLKQGAPGTLDGTAADYLVSGALFALSGGLNIQVSLYPLAVDKQVLQFSILSQSPSALLGDIEGLAAEMAAAVYQEAGIARGGAAQEPAVDGTAMFVTPHPELAYKQGQYTGMVIGAPDGLVAVRALGGKQSISFGREVERMVVGDLDGDGSDEILTLAGRQLQVFAVQEKRWREIDSFRLPVDIRCHALNLADLDGDGRQEIYLSGTEGIDVSSMIATWGGQGEFRVLAQRLRWYLRPLPVAGQGWRLAGQQRGVDKLDLLRPGVFLLEVDTDYQLSRGTQLPLPRGVNLFDFVYADLDGDGALETVAVDRREKLRVYGPNNDLLWVSREN
ncbi:MAG: VCBS repeat-containing protein, partial [Desulforhopalus sp.]|nr:VCBS repeat-containing protein [Desulforhopalus sp.]